MEHSGAGAFKCHCETHFIDIRPSWFPIPPLPESKHFLCELILGEFT